MGIVRLYFEVFSWIRVQLDHPIRVFVFSIALFCFSLMTSGLWWKLWALQRDYESLGQRIIGTQDEIRNLEGQIKLASDIQFIERQAKERLDLVDENDLVFVFSDN